MILKVCGKPLCCFQGQLREAIRDMVLRCTQTLFIFDEAEKLHSGLIDAIKPYMDHYDNVDGVNYRGAIFLFLRSVGLKYKSHALHIWRHRFHDVLKSNVLAGLVLHWREQRSLMTLADSGHANIWQLIHAAIISIKCWHVVRWARCLHTATSVEWRSTMSPWIFGTLVKIVRILAWRTWSIDSGPKRWSLKVRRWPRLKAARTSADCFIMSSVNFFLDFPPPDTPILLSRRLRSERPDVRPPDRLLCAVPAPRVPPHQTVRPGRLCSPRHGGGRGDTGRGGQGDAVRPQGGATVLSPGMQVHTAADQLLSPVEEG